MDFYSMILAKNLNGSGGGGGDPNSTFKLFENGNLENLTAEMLDGVTNIGNYAFYNCDYLTSVTIPNSVASIGTYAFAVCVALKSVTVLRTSPPTLESNVFSSTPTNLIIYVPASSVDAYKTASGWSSYKSKIQAIPTE